MAVEKEIKEEEERKLSKVHMFVYFQLRTMPVVSMCSSASRVDCVMCTCVCLFIFQTFKKYVRFWTSSSVHTNVHTHIHTPICTVKLRKGEIVCCF